MEDTCEKSCWFAAVSTVSTVQNIAMESILDYSDPVAKKANRLQLQARPM